MPCSIMWLGKRSAVDFALKSMQSEVKKILRDLGTLKKVTFYSLRNQSYCFILDQFIKQLSQ